MIWILKISSQNDYDSLPHFILFPGKLLHLSIVLYEYYIEFFPQE